MAKRESPRNLAEDLSMRASDAAAIFSYRASNSSVEESSARPLRLPSRRGLDSSWLFSSFQRPTSKAWYNPQVAAGVWSQDGLVVSACESQRVSAACGTAVDEDLLTEVDVSWDNSLPVRKCVSLQSAGRSQHSRRDLS